MRDAMSILIRPVVSEKTYGLMDNHTYVFVVDPRPPRSTCATPSSRRSTSRSSTSTLSTARASRRVIVAPVSRHAPGTKRAIVTLKQGDSINLFEN